MLGRDLFGIIRPLGLASRGIGFFGEILAKVGLRAIPVVGEILLLIDTIRFLGTHSKDIGKGIGIAARWIMDHGGPMLRDAFVGLVTSIYHGVVDTIGGLFHGGHGGLFDVIRSGIKGFQEGYGPPTPGGKQPPQSASHLQRAANTPHHVAIMHGHVMPSRVAYVPMPHSGGAPITIHDLHVTVPNGATVETVLESAKRHFSRGDVPNSPWNLTTAHSGATAGDAFTG